MIPLLALTASALAQTPTLEPLPDEAVPTLGWTTEVCRLRSEVLGESFRLFIARPPSFEPSHEVYPALYLLDGQHYFPEVLSSVAALASTGAIPELVLIGIESRDRRRDFTPREIRLPDVGDRARADEILDFLERELVPAVEAGLRTGRPRVLLGHSHAGILALHALSRRPGLFPWVIELDTPVHLEQGFLARSLTEALGDQDRSARRLVSVARVFGWSDEEWTAMTSRARPGDLFVRERIEDETHESMVFAATYRALKRLFADFSALETRNLAPLEIEARYRDLAASYGVAIAPPGPLMRQVVEDFLMEGRGRQASEWLQRLVRAHGAPADLADLVRRVDEVTAQGDPGETVAELLERPRASPEEMRPHLGTWRGTSGPAGGFQRPMEVRFWIEQGLARGEVQGEQGPPMLVEYLQVRPDGALEFGYRNGMRPRGLLAYTEEIPGGPLEGELLFRGIRFTPREGEAPPRILFRLEAQPESGISEPAAR